MKLKNIVFDVGNVLVRCTPYKVIGDVFPELNAREFFQKMQPVWIDWNLGKFTESKAIDLYQEQFGLARDKFVRLMEEFKTGQAPMLDTLEIVKKLDSLGMNLYSITNNIKEFVKYHRQHSEFPHFFKDIIVSADVGLLKPDRRIYLYLLEKHRLNPAESVFIDDLIENVEGARAVGMQAFQFTDAKSCEDKLRQLGVPIQGS